jgi:dsRNA-specific ribonuclease
VRALMGALYLHGGRLAAKSFFREHFTSRQLNIATLFNFRHPQRDLSRLCAREGFQAPVARAISETGRKSRHPIFVIGVFSGKDKLGEGAGASIDEARACAAVAALKGWYLYSPLELRVPSETEEPGAPKWDRLLVDPGDIVF